MTDNELLAIIFLLFTIIEVMIMVALLKQKRYRIFAQDIIIYLVTIVFLYCQFKSIFNIPAFIIVLSVLSILGHTYLGQFLDLYHKSKSFDKYLHFFGSLSFSLLAYSLIYTFLNPVGYSPLYVFLFVTAIGISLGVLLEIFEFTLDILFKSKNQHGLNDTNFDLISDVLGAVLAGIIAISVFP